MFSRKNFHGKILWWRIEREGWLLGVRAKKQLEVDDQGDG